MTAPRWLPSRWSVIAHGVPATLSALLVTRWAQRGTHIAAGDVIPFVRNSTASEMTSLWNHQTTGSGSTSVEIIRLIEVMFIEGVGLVGGSNELAQALFYAICLSLAAVGCSRLVSVFVSNPWVVAVAGLLGVVNPFVLVQMPNPLFLVAIGAIGLLVAELAGPILGRPSSVPRLVVATTPFAYLALNPALVGVAALCALISVGLIRRYAGRDVVRTLLPLWLRATGWSLGFHMWWIVPVFYVNLIGVEGAEFDAVTNVEDWSWSHSENSLTNVITLTAHWGWPVDSIFPWAGRLDGQYGQLARWALPAGAVLAPVLAGGIRKRLAVAMTGGVVVLVFIAKGLHAPLGSVNLFFYDNVPGLWLLREPSSKVGPVLVLLLVCLFAITIDELIARGHQEPRLRVAAGLLLVGALTFPWPLISGSVIADDRGELQSMHVDIPDEWFETTNLINRSNRDGKVLILPSNDFYQVTTSWGYHGADAIPLQLLERPVIQRYPGGYFDLQPGFSAILERIEHEIIDGSTIRAGRLMEAAGVSHVVHRLDLIPGPVAARYAPATSIKRGLSSITGLSRVHSSSVADVYELGTIDGPFEIDQRLIASAGDSDDLALLISEMGPEEVLIDDAGPADVLLWRSDAIEDEFNFTLDESGMYKIEAVPGKRTAYLSAAKRGENWEARLEDRSFLTLDTLPLPSADSTVVKLPGEPMGLRYGTTLELFHNDMALTIGPDDPVEWLYRLDSSSETNFGELGDCDRSDQRTLEALGIAADRRAGVTTLSAADHSACVHAGLGSVSGPTVIELEYRALTGDGGRLCLYDESDRTCVVDQRLEETSDWRPVRALADFKPDHWYQLYVYAVGGGDGTARSVVDYRNGTVVELQAVPVELGSETSTDIELAAGPHQLRVAQPRPATSLDRFSEVNDCHRADERSASEAGLAVSVNDGVVQLRADAHSACTNVELSIDPGRQYDISFDYRTIEGQTAYFCLWMTDLQRCVETDPLDHDSSWRSYRAEFEVPQDAGPVMLFLYANSNDSPVATVVEFSALAVHPTPERLVRVERLHADERVIPSLRVLSGGPADFEISIEEADGPFVLTMAESHAAGWKLDGLPKRWTARHLESNAYGNVWLVDGVGDAVLGIEYGPNDIATIGQWLSVVTALMTSLPLVRRYRLETEFEKDRDDPDRLFRELVRPAKPNQQLRRKRVRV
jgi:arabinofuranan 3-O-arabinosyltransferase